jgi:phage terminase Nu1 subunit (DNA packaging protein)
VKNKGGRPKGSTSERAAAASRRNGKMRRGAAFQAYKGSSGPSNEIDNSLIAADTRYQRERANLTGLRARREQLRLDREAGRLIPVEDIRVWVNGIATALRRVCDGAVGMSESLDGVTAETLVPCKELARRLADRLRNALASALTRRPGSASEDIDDEVDGEEDADGSAT